FGVELPVRAVFEAPTVEGLAHRLERGKSAHGPAIERLPGEERPLSFAQQRLWFLDQLEPGTAVYNIPAAVEVTGRLEMAALAATFSEVMRRHEALRTVFRAAPQTGEPVKTIIPIGPASRVEPPVVDLAALPERVRGEEAARIASAEARRPFDLSGLNGEALLRTTVLRQGPERFTVLVMMHHIVSDGWSLGVLVRELGALYAAFSEGRPSPLPELAVQYADFAAWQRRQLSAEWLEPELAWWRGQLAGMPLALDLMSDRPRPATLGTRGAEHHFALDGEALAGLNRLSRRHGATLFMTLLAGFTSLLHRFTGQDDLAVATPVAGRTRVEAEPLIGLFVNTLVLRADLTGDLSF